jgi:hypothetical protein
MPPESPPSNTADANIRRLRARGVTWNAIAAALRVSPWALIGHARRIGARRPLPRPPAGNEPDDPAREPLGAGHPAAWRLLTAGTLLAGVRYPWPPVLENSSPSAIARDSLEGGR